jgi:hypothetical protein
MSLGARVVYHNQLKNERRKAMKWNVRLTKDKSVEVQCLKDEAKKFQRTLDQALRLSSYCKETTGQVEKPETWHETTYMMLGGSHEIKDAEGYNKAIQELLGMIPDFLKKDQFQPIMDKANEIYNTFIPTQDKRETQSQIDERNAIVKGYDEARQAKTQDFVNRFCLPEKIKAPEGYMSIYLEITFDDSDSMTDYFHPHAQIGHDMLLGIVPKQAGTERIHRSVLERYPELNKLTWTWHTENYSMGHGNYLISEYPEDLTFPQGAYDGRKEVHARYEIRSNTYEKEVYAYKDYPGNMPKFTTPDTSNNGETKKAIVTKNEQHNGIEVRFDSKPDESILSYLKSNGFRWSKFQKIWYTRFNESLFQEVNLRFQA